MVHTLHSVYLLIPAHLRIPLPSADLEIEGVVGSIPTLTVSKHFFSLIYHMGDIQRAFLGFYLSLVSHSR